MTQAVEYLRHGAVVALFAGLGACASTPELDPRQLQQAETAIQEAREVNAGRHAAGTLARAEERLEMARQSIDSGDEQEARFLLDEAVVLAELAEARALERDSQQALNQIRNHMSSLRERLGSPEGG